MQRIDVQSASPTLPAPVATGKPGFFTEGDALGGVAATIVSADFLNMIQEELISVVVAANISPSKADHSQLLAAIMALIGGGTTASIGDEGSISFAGGLLILKWGTMTIPAAAAPTTSAAHGFPQPFPQKCFGVLGSPTAATAPSGWNPVTAFVPLKSAASFTVVIDSTDPGHNIVQNVPFFYVAIGN